MATWIWFPANKLYLNVNKKLNVLHISKIKMKTNLICHVLVDTLTKQWENKLISSQKKSSVYSCPYHIKVVSNVTYAKRSSSSPKQSLVSGRCVSQMNSISPIRQIVSIDLIDLTKFDVYIRMEFVICYYSRNMLRTSRHLKCFNQ